MKRLSDDTIRRIFCFIISTPLILPPQANVGSSRRTLMTVCRRWRRLIEVSPALWSNVQFLPDSSVHPLRLLRFSQQWLGRTSGFPVIIKFDGDYTSANRGTAPTETKQLMYGAGHFCFIRNIVLPCAAQIMSLTCTIGTNETIQAFFRIPEGSFRGLRHLDILFINHYSDWLSEFTSLELSTFTVFRGVDSLRILIMHLLNGMHPLYLQIPWSQLTILDLGTRTMPPSVFRSIIQLSISLTEACFLVQFTSSVSATVPKRAMAPELRVLRLMLIKPENQPSMLKRLLFPRLLDLRLEQEDYQRGWNLSIYPPILRQAKALHSLTVAAYKSRIPVINTPSYQVFNHRNIPEGEFRRFFNAVPKIVTLRLPAEIQVGLFIIEEVSLGKFIPLLETLEVGSIHPEFILSMMSRRNELVTNAQLASTQFSESSAMGAARAVWTPNCGPPLRAITQLILLVEDDDDVLTSIQKALNVQQNGSIAGVNICVQPHKPKLFYHPQ